MKITVTDGTLGFGDAVLGPSTHLYAYPGEAKHLGRSPNLVVCKTPRNIDLLFAVGDKVVGCEVKTFADLVTSWRKRRLHRQLRALVETVDVPALVLRGGIPWLGTLLSSVPPIWGDLSNLQTQGFYLWLVPTSNYYPVLNEYRKSLMTNGNRILAGTDQRPTKERQPGWLLRRIPGIGPAKSAQLIAQFGCSLAALEAARRGAVRECCGKAVEERLCAAADS